MSFTPTPAPAPTLTFYPASSSFVPHLTPSPTITTTADPTGTAYIWTAPITPTEILLSKIFGFGLLALLAIASIACLVWLIIVKPMKLKAIEEAEEAQRKDIEKQLFRFIETNNGRPLSWEESTAIHALLSTEFGGSVSSPPLTAMPGRERTRRKQKKPKIYNPESFR